MSTNLRISMEDAENGWRERNLNRKRANETRGCEGHYDTKNVEKNSFEKKENGDKKVEVFFEIEKACKRLTKVVSKKYAHNRE